MFGVGKVSNLPAWAKDLPTILPHGSGIDQDWMIEGYPRHITCRNSFHCMDENGMYEGWQDFSIILKKPQKIEWGVSIKVHLHGYKYLGQKHMLREFLGNTIAIALSDFTWGKGIKKILRRSDADHVINQLENAESMMHEDPKAACERILEALDILRNAYKEARDVPNC